MRLLSAVLFVSISFGLTSVATPSSAASLCFGYKNGNTQLYCKVKGKMRYLAGAGGAAALYGWGWWNNSRPSDHRSK
jgi:hypothetical protein